MRGLTLPDIKHYSKIQVNRVYTVFLKEKTLEISGTEQSPETAPHSQLADFLQRFKGNSVEKGWCFQTIVPENLGIQANK